MKQYLLCGIVLMGLGCGAPQKEQSSQAEKTPVSAAVQEEKETVRTPSRRAGRKKDWFFSVRDPRTETAVYYDQYRNVVARDEKE
ncbi:MAG: hypothetical protein GF333_07800 [Candidatus Omnitrophica bacterium]|nr:hypothetical protein [Candidatus Omnitrophota bacterium]